MRCPALRVIKTGVWQSYYWPTAVITKGMHCCFWLASLGNVITKVCLLGGAQGTVCETPVFVHSVFPATLSSYPNMVLGHDTRREVDTVSNNKSIDLVLSDFFFSFFPYCLCVSHIQNHIHVHTHTHPLFDCFTCLALFCLLWPQHLALNCTESKPQSEPLRSDDKYFF